ILAANGEEEAYHLTPYATYLLIARTILVEHDYLLKDLKTENWWALRTLFLQQRILDDVVELKMRFYLEHGLVYHYYFKDFLSVEQFQKAQNFSGLEWKLTGALGKRTKFQTFDVTQLLIVANSSTGNNDEKIELTKQNNNNKNDEVVDKFDLKNQKNLKVIDQCILLAFCLNVKNINPSHGITTEQMVPYVTRVLENPNNWMVYTMALLLRSRLEKEHSRTMERSVLQLQALVDQFPLHELSSVKERILYFYQILIPSKWEMERELAIQYLSLGVVRSALQIFERLEMWEDVINCYIILEKEEKSKSIIQQRLLVTPNSPKLYCLLGDIEKNPKHWEHAWEVSGNRYARAMRSLGSYWYKQKNFMKSIECYEKALKINPLFENSWFIKGCAAMHMENWELAIEAFTRTISVNPENSESWNNLATIFLKQNRKFEAFNSFQQGLKLNYDNWKIWTNYMYTCVDIGEFNETIRAMERIVELRWRKDRDNCVDIEVLEIIVNAITKDIKDINKSDSSRLAPRLEKLLIETITSKITSNYEKDYKQSLESELKAYRSVLYDPKLESSEQVFHKVSKSALEVVEAYQNLGELKSQKKKSIDGKEVIEEEMVCEDWLYQAKTLLKSLIGRTKKSFEGTETHDQLIKTLKELK
ncbi:17498_t:CDS:2, partial [Entrophospora sp. SA101]